MIHWPPPKSLEEIADTLLLNGTLVNCPGLLHGKTGIAVFFFHYARHTGNELFEDYAIDLIEEVQAQIHTDSPADYKRGISGIGTGIDYLIRNGFLAPGMDIFEDFDKRMFRAVMYDPYLDFSLDDGLTGYGRYWIRRMNDQINCQQAQIVLEHIIDLIKKNELPLTETEQADISDFFLDLSKMPVFAKLANDNLNKRSVRLPSTNSDKQDQMGLLNGYAGYGMNILSATNLESASWTELL